MLLVCFPIATAKDLYFNISWYNPVGLNLKRNQEPGWEVEIICSFWGKATRYINIMFSYLTVRYFGRCPV